ncbi:hypothetical protein CBL_10058 [Carabus blaptoides fortunei]
MERAFTSVLEEQYSFGQAAEMYHVPKSTLYTKYRGLHGDKLRRPPVLRPGEEKQIVAAINVAANFRFPFMQETLKFHQLQTHCCYDKMRHRGEAQFLYNQYGNGTVSWKDTKDVTVVKLEVYDLSDNKLFWWKDVEIRLIFVTKSSEDFH